MGSDPISFGSVTRPDGRDQILVERTLEVVTRRELPVAARRAVVNILRPRIDDGLTFGIAPVADRGLGKRLHRLPADFLGRRVERPDIVRGPSQAFGRS